MLCDYAIQNSESELTIAFCERIQLPMDIAKASERSGLPAKTIRYHEGSGLVRPERTGNGSRVYVESDIHKLTFLQRARILG